MTHDLRINPRWTISILGRLFVGFPVKVATVVWMIHSYTAQLLGTTRVRIRRLATCAIAVWSGCWLFL